MDRNLYGLIGGGEKLRAAVAAFYKKVLADETLRRYFDDVDLAQLSYRQNMFMAMLLGGPVSYSGEDLSSAHAGVRSMGLNKTHFDAFLRHFREALEEQGVLPGNVDEIISLLETRSDDVLKRRRRT
jgi:truncated hemoglobin YjbI